MSGGSFGGGGSGGGVANIATISTDYTAAPGDLVLADATAGAITVTVPVTSKATVTVKKTDSSTNPVAIKPTSGNIDGAPVISTASQGGACTLVGNGTNLYAGPLNRNPLSNFIYNVNATTMAAFRSALATARAGGAATRVVAMGDSLTQGYNAVTSPYAPQSWPVKTRSALSGRLGLPVREGVTWLSSAFIANQDTRLTVNSPWSILTGFGPGNGIITANSVSTGTVQFGPVNCDRFIIYYVTSLSAGTGLMDVQIDAETATTINCNGSLSMQVATVVSGAGVGNHTLKITNRSNVIAYIMGIEPCIGTTGDLRVGSIPRNGTSLISDWSSAVNSPADPITGLGIVPYGLATLMIGTNDQANNNLEAAFSTALASVVAKMITVGSVLLLTIPPNNQANQTLLSVYNRLIFDRAYSSGCGVVDVAGFMATINASRGGSAADFIHMSANGYTRISELMTEAILSAAGAPGFQ